MYPNVTKYAVLPNEALSATSANHAIYSDTAQYAVQWPSLKEEELTQIAGGIERKGT